MVGRLLSYWVSAYFQGLCEVRLLRKKFPGNDDLKKNRRELADLKSLRTHPTFILPSLKLTANFLKVNGWKMKGPKMGHSPFSGAFAVSFRGVLVLFFICTGTGIHHIYMQRSPKWFLVLKKTHLWFCRVGLVPSLHFRCAKGLVHQEISGT